MYQILAATFFFTVLTGVFVLAYLITGFRSHPLRLKVVKTYGLWLVVYAIFITFFTGPVGSRLYDPPATSPYKLPWKSGIARFVSQGNRSFTSHRDLHLYAWDFWMPIGTEVLAARSGTVKEVEQSFDGIGLQSNYVLIEHVDGSRAMYAHIKKDSSVVKPGQKVVQGEVIAYSGMVGQTINPHLHFVVLDHEGRASLPITFSDVQDGVPTAGNFYTSSNLQK